MKIFRLISAILLLSFCQHLYALVVVKCLSTDSIAVPNAKVLLERKDCVSDSCVLVGITDRSGTVSFMNVIEGEYLITLDHDYFETLKTDKYLNGKDTLSLMLSPLGKMLEDVEVQAAWHRSYGTYEEMTLSKQNEEFGVSALDAVSSLPMFRNTIRGDLLQSVAGENVSIVIDGRPSTPQQLGLLVGTDIKKIRYYKVAPEKYRLLTAGEMIEVVLNKPQENEYRAGVGFHTATLDYSTLAYPYFLFRNNKHTFSVETNFQNYRLKPRNEEEFSIENVYNKVNTYKGSKYTHNNSFSIDYQYNGARDMVYFLIKPQFGCNALNTESSVFSILNGIEAEGLRNQNDHSKNRGIFGQLYYTHDFNNDMELSVEVSDDVGRSDSRTSLRQDLDMNGYSPIDIFTRNKENYNEFKGMAAFSFPLFRGKFTATAQYSLLEVKNRYVYPDKDISDESRFYQNQFHQYYAVSWFRMFGKIGANVRLTAPISRYHLDTNDRYRSGVVLPDVRVYYNPNQNWSLSGTFVLSQNNKTYSDLNDFETWYNPYFVNKNTVEQDNFPMFYGQIDATYTPDRKLYLSANVRGYIADTMWQPDFEREGNIMVERSVKCHRFRFIQFNLTPSWRPFDWWQLMAFCSVAPISIKYPDYNFKDWMTLFLIQSSFNYKSLSASLLWRSKFNTGLGLVKSEIPMQFNVSLSYRIGGFSVGAQYTFPYSSRDKKIIEKGDFRYYNLTKFASDRHEASLQFIYRFKSGQSRSRKDKQNVAIDGVNTHKIN